MLETGGSEATTRPTTSWRADSSPRSGTLFDQLRATLPDEAFIAIDRNGVVVDATDSVNDVLELQPSSILHRHLDVFIHPDDRAVAATTFADCRRQGDVSHWAVIRVAAKSGWRRIEGMAVLDGTVVVAYFRRLPFSTDASVQNALDQLTLPLAANYHASPSVRVEHVLGQLLDMVGWTSGCVLLDSGSGPSPLAVVHRSASSHAPSPGPEIDLRIAECIDARPQRGTITAGSRFRTPIGSPTSGSILEISHERSHVTLSGRQRLIVESVARSLAESWDRWATTPDPDPNMARVDPTTRLASRLALIDDLDLRLGDARPVAVFRVGLEGLEELRSSRDDDAAAHIVVAVAHAIRFVLDDATIARTADDELTAITSELDESEDPADVATDLLHEMEESFSWRFGVQPVVAVAAGDGKSSAGDLLGRSQDELTERRRALSSRTH